MHPLRRSLLVAVLIVMALPAPAEARRVKVKATCDSDGCEATAGSERGGSTGRRRSTTRRPVSCGYHRLDVPADTTLYQPDGSPIPVDGTGTWYERFCVDAQDVERIEARYPDHTDPRSDILALQDSIRAVQRRPVYLRPQIPSLVDEAFSRLTFPTLQPRFSPSVPWTFVNHPTALWLEGDWQPVSATAEVPGVRVVVTAEPTEVRWDLGNGESLICPSPGRPPNPAVTGDHGDCTATWRWPSVGRPASAYQVTGTVIWHATWTAEGAPGGGDLGTVPRRSPSLAVPVAEIHVLNVPPADQQ